MDAFCPSCGANVGFGTIAIIGCPLCGYGEDEEFDDEFDDEIEEKESRQKVSVRSRTATAPGPRTRTKKKPTKKG